MPPKPTPHHMHRRCESPVGPYGASFFQIKGIKMRRWFRVVPFSYRSPILDSLIFYARFTRRNRVARVLRCWASIFRFVATNQEGSSLLQSYEWRGIHARRRYLLHSCVKNIDNDYPLCSWRWFRGTTQCEHYLRARCDIQLNML